jgi:SAM-dependent methyltransferase
MTDTPQVPDYDDLWTRVYGDIQKHGPVHRHMRRLISEILEGLSYDSVLDVGCGPAENYALLSRGRHLSRFGGVDISSVALGEARKRVPSGEFWNLDVQKEHLESVWDLVHCSLIFEHLPDDVAALEHLRPMTKRYLLLSTIAGDYERYRRWDEAVGHVRNYPRGELEAKMTATGFRVLRSIYWGFPLYSPLTRELLNLRRVGLGSYGTSTRLLAWLMYYVYFLNSSRRGDLLIVLAERTAP